jgi:clan AA aspartic protease
VNGQVDDAGRALVSLDVRTSVLSTIQPLTAWIDTAFTGELVVPRSVIQQLQLPQSAAIMARLADGSEVLLETYQCLISWFGRDRIVEVIENDGQYALLGIGMLMERRIEIDYRSKEITVE